MPGGVTFMASLNANIATPIAGKVTVFFSLDSGVPSYKDSAGVVWPLGTNGATGATGPAGPALSFLESLNEIEPMMVPGPQGIAGSGGGSGGLIGIQTITATGAGTYTPTANTGSVVIELVGGGGGGGGVQSPGGTNVAFGRSAGGGAYLRKRLTTGFSGASYSVGAKGTGGTAGANAGTAGGNTTFTETVGPTVFTAGGGVAGGSITSNTPPIQFSGNAGGTATNGDINVSGGRGGWQTALNNAYSEGGYGGDSYYGTGGTAGATNGNINTSAAGGNATGKGGGGGGAGAVGTGVDRAGGDGSDGMIIVWEYSV